MVGKSATVAFIRGVAKCLNTFLRHSFLPALKYSGSKIHRATAFRGKEGLAMGFEDSLKLEIASSRIFYLIYQRIDP